MDQSEQTFKGPIINFIVAHNHCMTVYIWDEKCYWVVVSLIYYLASLAFAKQRHSWCQKWDLHNKQE